MTEPLDELESEERAAALLLIFRSRAARELRRQLIALDDTTTWRDPSGKVLADRIVLAKQADRAQVDRILRQSIARGDTPHQAAKAARDYLTPVGATPPVGPQVRGRGMYSARRLGRNEVARAWGRATIEATRRTYGVLLIRWRVSGRHDPKVDKGQCLQNVGIYRPSELPAYPAHIGCRCVLLPVIEDVGAIVNSLRERISR